MQNFATPTSPVPRTMTIMNDPDTAVTPTTYSVQGLRAQLAIGMRF
jgi:hypothetical protein